MRFAEVCFWTAVYWLAYLPISFLFYFGLQEGSVIGILLTGMLLCALFVAFVVFQEGVILPEIEPAIIVEVSKKKRKVILGPSEVKNEDKEPSPKMRTDVELDKLDVPDDAIAS